MTPEVSGRFLAECRTCCSEASASTERRVSDWADAHEGGHEGHRVTVSGDDDE